MPAVTMDQSVPFLESFIIYHHVCTFGQVLQEKYGGWQNISMINYFNDFANLCFERYGDRVKYWITFNNPWVCSLYSSLLNNSKLNTCEKDMLINVLIVCQSVAVEGYETGEHAPGLKLRGTGAYRAAHHIIKVTSLP